MGYACPVDDLTPARELAPAAVAAAGLVVPAVPRSVGLVRRYAVDASTALGWGESANTVTLLVSELATNAAVHASGGQIRVRVLDRGLRLRVEVSDDSPDLPVPRSAPVSAEDGRGLALVEALARRHGVDARHDGKTVWFEIGV